MRIKTARFAIYAALIIALAALGSVITARVLRNPVRSARAGKPSRVETAATAPTFGRALEFWSGGRTPGPGTGRPPDTAESERSLPPDFLVKPLDLAGLTRAVDMIVYDDFRGIQLVTADGERGAPLKAPGRGPSFSADGTKIVYEGISGKAGLPYEASDTGAVAYLNVNWDIYVMNVDGSDRRRLTYLRADDSAPRFSPDGKKIAFTSDRDGDFDIYVMNADGSGQTRLTTNDAFDYSPAWSPDGAKIIFESGRDGNYELYIMNADGSDQRRITDTPGGEGGPVFFPDGQRIAFSYRSEDNEERICSCALDGSGRKVLLKGDLKSGLAVRPDGKEIAFTAEWSGEYRIHTIDAEAGFDRDKDEYGPGCLGPEGLCPCSSPSFSPMRVDGVLYDTYGHVIEE